MTVTLETLRADYEATEAAFNEALAECRAVRSRFPDPHLPCFAPEYLAAREKLSRALAKANSVGWLWAVAEQHGLEAAMLWKLSDGAIDPRKAGEA